jgi:hypothetical protein
MAGNPILTYLPLNGTLAGTDRNGAFTATGSGALRWQPAQNARINLIPNSRAATAITGWQGQNGVTITREVDAFGMTYFRLVNPGGSVYAQMIANSAQIGARWKPAANGLTYTLSFDVKCVSGYNVLRSSYRATTLTGSYVTNVSSIDTTIGSSWQRVVITGVVTVGADYDSLSMDFANTTTNAHEWLISNIVIEYGSVPNATYFDGNSPGCSWLDPSTGQLGTAHASPSCNQVTAWIEEGTTNLCRNSSVEAASLVGDPNLLGAGTIITKDATSAFLGSASAKVVCDGSGSQQGILFGSGNLGDTSTARTFTGSVYVRGSGTLRYYTRCEYADLSVEDSADLTVTLTNQWQRIVANPKTANTGKQLRYVYIQARTNTAQAVTFWADCAQVEEKSYATSYTDGSLGTGYSWAGTAHASASTREGVSIYAGTAGRISKDSGEIAAKYSVQIPADAASHRFVFNHYNSGSSDSRIYLTNYGSSGTKMALGLGSSTVLVQDSASLVMGSWYNAGIKWDGSLGSLYKEGSLVGSPTAYSGMTASPANFFIGANNGTIQHLNGLIGPVAIYDAPLSDARRALVNTAIDNYDDLWSLFEEWDTQLQPVDLLALQSGQATAGVTAEAQPVDLLALQSGQATAGVTAELAVLELDMMGEELVATARRPFPYLVTWRSP